MPTSEPDPASEAVEGVFTGALLMAFTGVAVAGGCLFLTPTIFTGHDLGPRPVATVAETLLLVLRCALVLLVALAPTVILAWRRHRFRRHERHQDRPKAGGTSAVSVASCAVAGDCPFCHAEIVPDDLTDGLVRCSGCEVAHHAECWREHAGCSTYGCRRDPRQRALRS